MTTREREVETLTTRHDTDCRIFVSSVYRMHRTKIIKANKKNKRFNYLIRIRKLIVTRRAWHLPAWWSPSAVLQTPNFWGNMGKFAYYGKRSRLGANKRPAWYKNLRHISCTGRVIASFVFKPPNLCYGHILLTAVLPCCKSRPKKSLLHVTSEHQCYMLFF